MTSSAGATNAPARPRCAFMRRALRARASSGAFRGSRSARASSSLRAPASTVSWPPCTTCSATSRISVGDALPLGHLGRRLHALELLAKGARVGRRRRAPASFHALRRGGRSPVSAWKRSCTSGLRQVLDQLPRRVLVLRARGTRPGSSRRRSTRPARPGPGSGAVIQSSCTLGRQAPLELADVPRARRCRTRSSRGRTRPRRWRSAMLVDRRRQPCAEHVDVEVERAPKARRCESCRAAAVAQQRIVAAAAPARAAARTRSAAAGSRSAPRPTLRLDARAAPRVHSAQVRGGASNAGRAQQVACDRTAAACRRTTARRTAAPSTTLVSQMPGK